MVFDIYVSINLLCLSYEYHGEDIEQFKPHTYHPEPFKNTGYVLPYGDDPLDDEEVLEKQFI